MQILKNERTVAKRLGLNRYSYDEVTEYTFTTTRTLDTDGILEVLKQNDINLYGMISTFREEIDFSIEQMAKVFKYTAQAVMF